MHARESSRLIRQYLLAVAALGVAGLGLGAWLLIPGLLEDAAQRRAALTRITQENQVTLEKLVEKIEAVRVELGRLPKTQKELVAEMGWPMPSTAGPRERHLIYYYLETSDSYRLVSFPGYAFLVFVSGEGHAVNWNYNSD